MELGLDFDDCDLVERPKEKKILKSYNAKICYPQWFLADSADNGKNDKATLYKFKGEYHFSRQDYKSAVECYQESLGALGSQNRTMRRELVESLARCNIYLENFTKAKEFAQQMLADCLTGEQVCQALMLQQQLHKQAGQLTEEAKVLHKLVYLHPFNVHFWLMLVDVYKKINKLQIMPDESCGGDRKIENKRYKHCSQLDTHKSCEETEHLSITDKKDRQEERSEDQRQNIKNADQPKTDLPVDFLGISNQNITTGQETKCDTEQQGKSQGDHGGRKQDFQEDFSEILSQYPCDLMQLTCYVRIRLLLLAVQVTVGSFIRDKNADTLAEVEIEIQQLTTNDETLNIVTEFMKKDMYEDEYLDEQENKEKDQSKVEKSPCIGVEEFNNKWFSWITDIHV